MGRRIQETNVIIDRFEVLTAVKLSMLFSFGTPCGFVGRYQRFGGARCLHLQP
jgi:hypothetical protein